MTLPSAADVVKGQGATIRFNSPVNGIKHNDDGTLTAEGYLIFDLMAGRTFGKLDLNLTINNLFDSAWREAQFADESAVTRGGPVVEQMHFTPGIPLSATVTASYRL